MKGNDNVKANGMVKENDKLCTWEIDLETLGKNSVVRAPLGCELVYIFNGEAEAVPAGRPVTVNSRQIIRNGDEEAVVCANTEKQYRILWGIGGINYFDPDYKLETSVGMCGDFKIMILQAPRLIKALGKREIGTDEIKDFISSKLQEIVCSKLSQMFSTKKYEEVQGLQTFIAQKIEEDCRVQLGNIGVKLVEQSFSLKTMKFEDDYIEKRKAMKESGYTPDNMSAVDKWFKDRKAESEKIAREEREKQEVANFVETVQALGGKSSLTCPECGCAVSGEDRFCPKCGYSLR